MLGYFKTTDIVGLYNAAHPISQLVQVFLLSLVLIYVPITSQLYAKKRLDEMRRNYVILTKWVVSATLPLFLVLFFFPGAVLQAFFGPGYMHASVALALRILALGVFCHVFFGPNAATLIVIGKTKLNLIDNLAGVIGNVVLNLLLIPTFGIIGAATASTLSFVVVNMVKSAQIFRSHKIHPFTRNYMHPVLASIVLISLIYVLLNTFWNPTITLTMLIALVFLFFALYGLVLLITRSVDQEDLLMLQELEETTGIDVSWLKRILERFM
jgi:O-antigen/teichoic acid export membrane protein